MEYSVAIRTLGTSGEALRRELVSLHAQTIMPNEIIIYIARGYNRPEFQIGIEKYVEVDKGMISQRALQYREVSAPNILLLDDDVELAPDSAEILLRHLEENNADCVAADTFKNHEMSYRSRFKAIIGGLVFPRFNQKWAFKLHSNGSFSYINRVKKSLYPSQSAAGPCSLWRINSFRAIHIEDEIWLEQFGFPYGEDALTFFKLYLNGGKLYVAFDSKVLHLDSKSSSQNFQKSNNKIFIRTIAKFMLWHRMHYNYKNIYQKITSLIKYSISNLWYLFVHIVISLISLDHKPFFLYIKGVFYGYKNVGSISYKSIPLYKNPKFFKNC